MVYFLARQTGGAHPANQKNPDDGIGSRTLPFLTVVNPDGVGPVLPCPVPRITPPCVQTQIWDVGPEVTAL